MTVTLSKARRVTDRPGIAAQTMTACDNSVGRVAAACEEFCTGHAGDCSPR